MNVKIHELAALEFDEAIRWYDIQSTGLGKRFKKTVLAQIRKIRQAPDWFLVEDGDIYKAYIPKFPYKILFSFGRDTIVIWAVSHLHRRPWHWQARLDE
ncbi:hypothetical protein JCM14469_10390 [Desulfatiferula olefinivorans]